MAVSRKSGEKKKCMIIGSKVEVISGGEMDIMGKTPCRLL